MRQLISLILSFHISLKKKSQSNGAGRMAPQLTGAALAEDPGQVPRAPVCAITASNTSCGGPGASDTHTDVHISTPPPTCA